MLDIGYQIPLRQILGLEEPYATLHMLWRRSHEENIRNIPVWVAVSPDMPIHHLVAVKLGEWITNSLVVRS